MVIFCDGDFWHGRDWKTRKAKLQGGHNPKYWVAKIERNIARDREQEEALDEAGWSVLRFWESDIKNRLDEVVAAARCTLRSAKERQYGTRTYG